MYGRLGCACQKRYRSLGAVNTKGLISTGVGAGTTAAVSAIGSGAAIGSFAGPIGAAAGLVAGLLLSANHPYGTCAPNAADMASFLQCWKHPIPAGLIPVWTDMWGGSDGKGWVSCFGGASGGQPPAGGCRGTNSAGETCQNGLIFKANGQPSLVNGAQAQCAPAGTVQSMRGGGYDIAPPASSAADPLSAVSGALSGDTAGIPNLLLLALAGAAAYALL